jgi:hypothetical protein
MQASVIKPVAALLAGLYAAAVHGTPDNGVKVDGVFTDWIRPKDLHQYPAGLFRS